MKKTIKQEALRYSQTNDSLFDIVSNLVKVGEGKYAVLLMALEGVEALTVVCVRL